MLIPNRDFENRDAWRQGIDEIGGPANVLVTSYRPDPSYNGRTLEEIARAQNKDAVTLVIEMIRAAGPKIGIMGTSMDERDLETFVRHPQVVICSDGAVAGPHPRGYGAFPRVLARYVRERKLLTIEKAIAKMTGRTAEQVRLRDRSVLLPAKKADLVIFDPAAITDRGTRENPAQMAAGIEHVIVKGEVVLEAGKMTGARPGRGLRRGSSPGPFSPKPHSLLNTVIGSTFAARHAGT